MDQFWQQGEQKRCHTLSLHPASSHIASADKCAGLHLVEDEGAQEAIAASLLQDVRRWLGLKVNERQGLGSHP